MLRDFFGFHRQSPYVAELTSDYAALAGAIHAASFIRAWDSLELERMIASANHFADGVFSQGTLMEGRPPLLGFAISRLITDEAEILTIAIKPEARGQGVGHMLLEYHLEKLMRSGARTVFLEVNEGNAAAISLYRSAGFSDIGRRPGYYLEETGNRSAAITMQLQFK